MSMGQANTRVKPATSMMYVVVAAHSGRGLRANR
jgi:hypothetical protein